MFKAPNEDMAGGFRAPERDLSTQPQENTWGGVPGKFIKGAVDTAKGIYNLGTQSPQQLHETFSNPNTNPAWQMVPHPTVDENTGKMGFDGGGLFHQAKNILTSPVQAFKKDPFGTTMAVAPILGKAAGFASNLPVVSDAIEGTRRLLSSGASKLGSYIGDIPEESVSYRMQNPSAVKNASDISQLASKDVTGMANKFDQAISGLHDEASKRLSTSRFLKASESDPGGAFTKDEVLGAIGTARKKLGGVYTPEAQSASNTLGRISDNLNKIRNTVSQNQVHDLIIDLDREIPWDKVWKAPEDLTLQDKALIDSRAKLDSLLKSKNPQYAEIMKPMSEAIQNKNEFLKNFNVQNIKGAGYQPGNQTPTRLFGATNEDRLATKRILGNAQQTIGEDLTPKIKAAQVKADFQPESGRSFRGNEMGIKQIFGRPAVGKAIDKLQEYKGGIDNGANALDEATKVAPAVNMLDAKGAQQYMKEAQSMLPDEKDREKIKSLARKLALRDGKTIPKK